MLDYAIENIDMVDSPSLVLYESHLMYNIDLMLSMVNHDTKRLIPHIKTVKMHEVVKRMVDKGIYQFKVATIGETELAARAGARYVLLAHQLVGPKQLRFFEVMKKFPDCQFATILDNVDSARQLEAFAKAQNAHLPVFVDINNGMDRTGIALGEALEQLVAQIASCEHLEFSGFHVYDGHFRQPDYRERRDKVEKALEPIPTLFGQLKKVHPDIQLICGGSPTFSIHSKDPERVCSPGTCVLWDWNYAEKLQEQPFKYAVLVITRVISKPAPGIVTIDMGHKSIAPENPIEKRIKFLNLNDYKLLSQSEEHGVLQVGEWDGISIGDVLYGVPYHICPTINSHEHVNLVRGNRVVDRWAITRER